MLKILKPISQTLLHASARGATIRRSDSPSLRFIPQMWKLGGKTHVRIYVYIYTYLYTHTCIPTYLPTYLLSFLYENRNVHVKMHMHVCMYVPYMCVCVCACIRISSSGSPSKKRSPGPEWIAWGLAGALLTAFGGGWVQISQGSHGAPERIPSQLPMIGFKLWASNVTSIRQLWLTLGYSGLQFWATWPS